jgi:L-2,4-diaminobutyrate decarboxylase
MIGWPSNQFAGLVTSGGSLANLTALTTARNVALDGSWEGGLGGAERPAIVVHSDAHYCVTRAAGVLGIGTENVIRVPLDGCRRMDPDALDALLGKLRRENREIIAVVGCACATPIGAFDPLQAIADVCDRHEVWLHVDAAHGGSALLSARHRHLLDGVDRVASLVWDAHKMLFVPALCAFVFYRDRQHRYETFRQDAPYLFDPSSPGMAEYDSGLVTVECTKRAAAYGLWGTWSLFGPQLFADMLDVTFDVAKQFHALLVEAEDFEALHVPQCNIVAFRYVPSHTRDMTTRELSDFQRELRRRIIQSGQFYIVQTSLDGVAALRLCVANPLTTVDHMRDLMDTIRRAGMRLRNGNPVE